MKNAVVMGASGEIGEAIVRRLAQEGYNVYCHYYQNEQKMASFLQELRVHYPKQDFFMVCLDMLNEADIPSFVASILSVNVLIFAGGFSTYKLLSEMQAQEIEALWQIHVKTPLLLCRSLQEKLTQKQSSILFISSLYAKMGSSMESVYSAVKAAQLGFVKSYAKEVATLDITVNALLPGAVNTRMNQGFSDLEVQEIIQKIPLGRMAEPEEIAGVANFLVGSEARYMTGAIVDVNGGWL